MRVDLHTHTYYSADSTLRPAELVARAREVGLDRIAVTDHNRMDGAFEALSLDPELVIPGEEVGCADGTHIIGLYLSEPIPRGLPVDEVAARIRAQGGIVYAPHPFAYLRSPMPRANGALRVADVVEVFNARAFAPRWNARAARAAEALGLPTAASTDGHFRREIGNAYTELPAFSDAEGLREALQVARPVAVRLTHPLWHVRSLTTEGIRRAWWASPFGARPSFEPAATAPPMAIPSRREPVARGAA